MPNGSGQGEESAVAASADDHARDALRRIVILEAFHHWVTTQVLPKLDERHNELGKALERHERILARIERQLADPFLRRPKDEQ